jgi:hypothetical protein
MMAKPNHLSVKLDDAHKTKLLTVCLHRRITQTQWAEQHIDADWLMWLEQDRQRYAAQRAKLVDLIAKYRQEDE